MEKEMITCVGVRERERIPFIKLAKERHNDAPSSAG